MKFNLSKYIIVAQEALTNLYTYLSTIITIVGGLICIYGILQVGLSISSQDHTQRSTGILAIVGGLLIAFAQLF